MSVPHALRGIAVQCRFPATPGDHSTLDASAPLPQPCAALTKLARLLGRAAARNVFAAAAGQATPSPRQ